MGSDICQEPDIGQSHLMSVSNFPWMPTMLTAQVRQPWEPIAVASPQSSLTPTTNSPSRRGFETRQAGACLILGPRPSRGNQLDHPQLFRKTCPGFRVDRQFCSFLQAPQLQWSAVSLLMKWRHKHHCAESMHCDGSCGTACIGQVPSQQHLGYFHVS